MKQPFTYKNNSTLNFLISRGMIQSILCLMNYCVSGVTQSVLKLCFYNLFD